MRKRVELKKVCVKKNPADVLTKPLSHSVVLELLSMCMLQGPPRNRGSGRGGGGAGIRTFPCHHLTTYDCVE